MKKIDRNEQFELVKQVNALYTEVYGMYLDEQISHDELVSVQVHLWRINRIIKNLGGDK